MPHARPPVVPALLPPNLVWRSYLGGRNLRRFRLLPGGDDDHFPEDWLASTVRARNGKHSQHPQEGLGRVADSTGQHLVADLLENEPVFWLGTGSAGRRLHSLGVLWKLLDTFVRLQFQAHPDAAFARRHLQSNAGKTECWHVLGTRGEAHVYLGFQHPPSRAAWARMIREQQIEEMTACFDKIAVQPGDCYVVPAGIPHAIGAGIFMMELMEPADWVVRCEMASAGQALAPDECFMGLDLESCLDVFDFRARPVAEVRRTFQQLPRLISSSRSFVEEELIGPAWHEFFRLHRLRGNGGASWPGNELMLLVVLKGGGVLSAGPEGRETRAGQAWLLPGIAPLWEWRPAVGEWEILLAKLPVATIVD